MAVRWKIPAPASTACAAGHRPAVRRASRRRDAVARAAPNHCSKPIIHDQRRVIGKAWLLVDVRALWRAGKPRAQYLVINPPADILRPRLAAVRPPGVVIRLRHQRAKGVDIPFRPEQLIHPGPLLGQKARVLLVRLPVLQIDRLVRDIPVAADDVLASRAPELTQVRHERLQKSELRGLSFRSGRARGQIQRDDRQLIKLPLEITSLAIELVDLEAAQHPLRLASREYGDAGIA